MGGKIIGVCTRTRTGGLSTNRENGMKQRNTEKNTPPETRERERGGGSICVRFTQGSRVQLVS